MRDITTDIITNTKVNDHFSLLTFSYPSTVHPGQFVHLRLNDRIDPFLRRPFSIHDHDPKKKTITILYKLIGEGTQYLSTLPAGAALSVLGPLGNTFTYKDLSAGSKIALIGGGIGFAPLLFLARKLAEKKMLMHSFMGFKTSSEVFIDPELRIFSEKIFLSTDDGTKGENGFITDVFEKIVAKNSYDQVFVCGPEAMMKRVYAICKKNELPLQLSLESIMACAIGACMCCVTETQNGYKKVCSDGPVFNKEDLSW